MLHIEVVVVHSSIKECCCFEDFNATDKKECAGTHFFSVFSSFWREKAHRGTLLRGAPRTLRV